MARPIDEREAKYGLRFEISELNYLNIHVLIRGPL